MIIVIMSFALMLAGLIGYACCVLSSKISAEEERRNWKRMEDKWLGK